MKKYIIRRFIKMNGKFKTLYHEKLELSTNKFAMNVYVENVTKVKKKALVFYDLKEADKMAAFLTDEASTCTVLTTK